MTVARNMVAASFLLTGTLLLGVSPVHAGDCWVPAVDDGDRIGVADNAVLREKVGRAEAALRADRAANAIRDVRYQAHRSIEWEPRHPDAPLAAHVHAYLHKPDAWQGKCSLKGYADDVHFATLDVELNDLTELVNLAESSFAQDGFDAFYEPPLTGRREGYPIYANRVLVITPPGVAPLVPIHVAEYLDFWERKLGSDADTMTADSAPDSEWLAYIKQLESSDPGQAAELRKSLQEGAATLAQGHGETSVQLQRLRKLRASLSEAERNAPVYLTGEAMARDPFGYAKPTDLGAHRLVRINPALWRGVRSTQVVRSVALRVGLSRIDTFDNHDADASTDQVLAWLGAVELAPFRELSEK